MIDLLSDEQAHHLGQAHLDGIGVFEHGQRDFAAFAANVGIDLDALLAILLVEVAKLVAAERGRSALNTVDFDVLTASDSFWIVRNMFGIGRHL